MGLLLDCWGQALAEATFASSAWLAIILVASWRSRQPARRRLIARVGLIGLLTLLPAFVVYPDRPRILLAGMTRTASETPALGWLWALYVVLVMARLAWIGVGAAVGRWLVMRSGEPGQRAEELYRGLVRGRKVRPVLRVSGRVRRPVLVGIFRPAILIPAEWDDRATVQRMRLGFLHELAHAQNRDVAFQFLGRLAMACWVFLPGLSRLVRRMLQDHEILADLHAARCYGDWTHYATTLVDLAASHHRRVATEFAEDDQAISPLTERLSALLADPRGFEELPPALWSVSISTLGMSCLLALTTIQISLPGSMGRPPSASSPPLREVLRISHIFLEAGVDRPTELRVPFRLPERYAIECEVWCRGSTVVELAGARIGEPKNDADWHRFTMRREHSGSTARWDGRPVKVAPACQTWLSFACSPGGEARFREVVIQY